MHSHEHDVGGLAELRDAVAQLQHAYDLVCGQMTGEMPPEPEPVQARTPDGRFILLDALTALVAGRAALAELETRASAHRYPCQAVPPTLWPEADQGHRHACTHDAVEQPRGELVEHKCRCGMTWTVTDAHHADGR